MLQGQMTAAYADDNAGSLAGANLPVTLGTLYLAHFLGPSDAIKVLQAEPNTPAATIVNPSALKSKSNLSIISGRSAEEMLNWASDKMRVPRQAWPNR
jgi:hypothetical protein